jgi:hypothetical protein
MAEYRAYTVGDDGHFSGYEPLVCGDDAEAIELARRLCNGHDIELWCLERMVTRLPAITEKKSATGLWNLNIFVSSSSNRDGERHEPEAGGRQPSRKGKQVS